MSQVFILGDQRKNATDTAVKLALEGNNVLIKGSSGSGKPRYCANTNSNDPDSDGDGIPDLSIIPYILIDIF